MLIKNQFPILEYDTAPQAVIQPGMGEKPFPARCLLTFTGEVMDWFRETYGGKEIGNYVSEMRDFPVIETAYQGQTFCLVQAPVGAGSIAMMTEFLYGGGVETIFACGSCGALEEIPLGEVILPVKALRDEGASYHYLPPSRFVPVQQECVQALEQVLKRREVPYRKCAVWSTDGFFRETAEMVAYRREEGCQAVEMECATMAAIAQFRGKRFGQLLYSADSLADAENYDQRGGFTRGLPARERLFLLTLEGLLALPERD